MYIDIFQFQLTTSIENILCAFIGQVSAQNKMLYLCRDFNIDLLKIDTDDSTTKLYKSLTTNLFVLHISPPTRISSHSQTLIDYFLK